MKSMVMLFGASLGLLGAAVVWPHSEMLLIAACVSCTSMVAVGVGWALDPMQDMDEQEGD